MKPAARALLIGAVLANLVVTAAHAQAKISDLTSHSGDIPIRLMGYGLVVGLDGTGDHSFGSTSGSVQTVRSIQNLLRNFGIEIPVDNLRVRNVAAVLVTAEVSPYMRPGAHFDVQVASIGDATSLTGGLLYLTPLGPNPGATQVASAQGSMTPIVLDEQSPGRRFAGNRGAGSGSGRIADGGILELPFPAMVAQTSPMLVLRSPDLAVASRIAAAINAARGAGTAKVEDAGAVSLRLPPVGADSSGAQAFLAGIDTLPVVVPIPSRIVIDAHNGMVVAGGDMKVSSAVISLKGITVRVGEANAPSSPGVVNVAAGASVHDIAVGLQALGALPGEVAAVFDGLRAAGAINATVIVR